MEILAFKPSLKAGFQLPGYVKSFPVPEPYALTTAFMMIAKTIQNTKPMIPRTPITTNTYHPTRHRLGIAPHDGQKTARRLMAARQSEHSSSTGSGSARGAGRLGSGGMKSVVSLPQPGQVTMLPTCERSNSIAWSQCWHLQFTLKGITR